MRLIGKKTIALLLTLCVLAGGLCIPAAAASSLPAAAETALADTGAWLLDHAANPQVSAVGGEWAVIGLARSGYDVPPSWYTLYYHNLLSALQEKNGVLSSYKYTEYARVALALTAVGADPADVGGYDLLSPLGDFNMVSRQGINGIIYTLIALDAGGYAAPVCEGAAVQTTRARLLDAVTSRQLSDGGFSLGGDTADPDTTAMALQALAPYREDGSVSDVIDRALACLSGLQEDDGGFDAGSESAVQVIVALCALGIDPGSDARFVKNGRSVADGLLDYAVAGGGFKHLDTDKAADAMASEQGLYALAAYQRFLAGENALYDMRDAVPLLPEESGGPAGLPGKNTDVTVVPVVSPGKSFDDIAGSGARTAIEALAARGIINGVTDAAFEPARTMSRAEFATITVRALGLTPALSNTFSDVTPADWFASYVGTANSYGIVNGVSATSFAPRDTITREQAAVMVARAATLCGLDTALSDDQVRNVLAQFTDYTSSASWAKVSLAFCYQNGILPASVIEIKPQEAVTRAEIAGMVHALLIKAELL